MSRAAENRNIVGETDWMGSAACVGADPDLFFPHSGQSDAAAKQICRSCPVRLKCLDYALTNRQQHGIWGGLNDHERERARRQHQRNRS